MSDTEHTDSSLFLASLDLPPLALDVYQAKGASIDSDTIQTVLKHLEQCWAFTLEEFEKQHAITANHPDLKNKTLCVDLTWTDNEGIQQINRDFRGKDKPTDVLTFSLFADADPAEKENWLALPEVQLGSILISLEWAYQNTRGTNGQAQEKAWTLFVLTRFIHGLLHLLGEHHDTDETYQRVTGIQEAIIDAYAQTF